MTWTGLRPEVELALAGIFGALGIGQLLVWFLRWKNPGKDYTELSARCSSWWVMVGIFALALVAPRGVGVAFFAFLSFLALKEYLSMIPTRRADRRVLFWAYLAIPIQYWWVYREWYGMFIVFIPVYMFLFVPLRMITIGQTKDYLRAVGTINFGLMLTVFFLSHLGFLLVLRPKATPSLEAGPGLVLYLVALTQMNDVWQYVWGKSLGTDKIVPTVSPKKTWVGFLGGVLTTTCLSALIGPHLTPMDFPQSVFAGLGIAVTGFFGDTNLSALKRDLGVKDAGSMLPGHGGILDRLNSLTYTAPLFFHYIHYSFWWHTFGAWPIGGRP